MGPREPASECPSTASPDRARGGRGAAGPRDRRPTRRRTADRGPLATTVPCQPTSWDRATPGANPPKRRDPGTPGPGDPSGVHGGPRDEHGPGEHAEPRPTFRPQPHDGPAASDRGGGPTDGHRGRSVPSRPGASARAPRCRRSVPPPSGSRSIRPQAEPRPRREPTRRRPSPFLRGSLAVSPLLRRNSLLASCPLPPRVSGPGSS